MIEESPFTLDRFEYERTHLYYLSDEIMQKLKGMKHVYLIGSRGTGKTTLLNSMNWKERLHNDNLKKVLKNDPFSENFIGLYLRLPESQIEHIERWLTSCNDSIKASINGLYIDFLWIEELFNSLSELTIEHIFNVTIREEQRFVSEIFDNEINGFDIDFSEKPETLKSLAQTINKIRRKLEYYTAIDTDPKSIIDIFKFWREGEFGRKIVKYMAEFCKTYSVHDNEWYFKVCFDEAEVLSSYQRKVVNIINRLSQSEVFFIISYVSEIEEISDTTSKKLDLGSADRNIIDLNEITDSEFRLFAEGVANVRIAEKVQSEEKCEIVKLKNLLGKLNINSLLLAELKKCENKEKSEYWIKKARELNRTDFFKDQYHNLDELPIYQAYIVDHLKLSLPVPDDKEWKRRQQDSAEMRKRMVSAFMLLCNDIGHKIPYAYDQMVLQLSDNCIRDFLHQMDHIFIELNVPILDFIHYKGIDTNIQCSALEKASIAKKDYIQKCRFKTPKEIEKLIDGLGKLTASLQRKGGINSLKTHEKGKFILDTSGTQTYDKTDILTMVKDAGESGYLRLIKIHGNKWKFRMHTSLAPAYGFSYRGAHNETKIDLSEIWMITQSIDDDEHKKRIGHILSKYNPNDSDAESPQMELFK